MRQDRQYRSLEVCLQRLQAGGKLEQVAGAYPRWAPRFRPLLQAAQAAQAYADTIQAPVSAQSESRAAFLETAGEMIPQREPTRRRWGVRSVLILLALILAALMVAYLAVRISADTLPGDWLYPLKIYEERARLNLVSNAAERLSLEFASEQRRVEEVETLLLQGRVEQVQFSAGLRQMEVGEWQVGELRVSIPPDTRVVGKIQPGFYVTIHGQTQPEGAVAARQVQMRDYTIEGRLEELSSGGWVVDGVNLVVNTDTILHGTPEVGRKVQVIALRSLEGDLYARLIEVIDED